MATETETFAEVLVPQSAYPLGRYLRSYPSVSVEIERIVPVGGSTHYTWIEGERHQEFIDELRHTNVIEQLMVVDELPDRTLIRFEWESTASPLFRIIEEIGIQPVSMQGRTDGWTVRIRVPDADRLTRFIETCQTEGLPIELQTTYDSERLGDASDPEYGLTEAQSEALAVAFEAGYFDVPRAITLTELADEFDISEQAMSERLRRGLWSVLTATGFEDEYKDEDETSTDPSDSPDESS